MIKQIAIKALIVIGLATLTMAPAIANPGNPIDGCNDSGFFSKARALTDLCWTCHFPIKVFGITIPLPGRTQLRAPGKTALPLCLCPGRTGLPSLGISFGMWKPTHAIEVTRKPFCSPILFGINLLSAGSLGQGVAGAILQGDNAGSGTGVEDESAFYNFHWWSYPFGELIDLLTDSACSKIGIDMDYLYLTEIDPTWSNEMLALYTHPEVKLFTKVYAHAVCAADAVVSTTLRPMETAFWCAGSWGLLYPFSGKEARNNNPELHMLAGAKGLAAMHRRGLAKLQYGNMSICMDMFYFILPKQQYQLQNMWPWPQRTNAQWIGADSWRWGQWRNMPAVFEDRVMMQWTYQECCITTW